MKPKHQRLIMVLTGIAVMAAAAAAILYSFRDNMVFFYTPSQYEEKKHAANFNPHRTIRLGGLVKKGSIENLSQGGIRFTVTDLSQDISVTYQGLVPSLFRDGQGVVIQGTVDEAGEMHAQTLLAKHDEKYMPREVVDALKASGEWQENGNYTPPKTVKP